MKSYRIEGVIFDFDGTLTGAHLIDFTAIKEKVGCPPELPVLEYIQSIPDEEKRRRAESLLEDAEETAAAGALPNEGATELILRLKEKKLPLAILTRNRHDNVLLSLENFPGIDAPHFRAIISRDDAIEPKPHEAGVILAAERLGCAPENCLVVGDYHYDIEAGRRAGALTCYITNKSPHGPDSGGADFVIDFIEELIPLIEAGLPVVGGKLPNHILEKYLGEIIAPAPEVLVAPGVGEDTAAIRWGGEEVLLLKSDPITFIADNAGKYAVMVNANDIATTGGLPRWFLSTFLFPPGSTPAEMVAMMGEVNAACTEKGVRLCGGHTEVTDAVTRPVVCGMMAGTVSLDKLKKKSDMQEDDLIIMTKRIAVEGSAILAAECADALKAAGITDEEINCALNREALISILPEAAIAAEIAGVRAMHDVTEGGIATALEEFSRAGGRHISVDMNAVAIYSETERFCQALGIDPMGLIGSGTLLIVIDPAAEHELAREFLDSGIECSVIGRAGKTGFGITAFSGEAEVQWPRFDADELTKVLG